MPAASSIPVAMTRCPDYDPERVRRAVFACLDASGFAPPNGGRVLVKPNLLKATPDGLVCTHPQVAGAACAWLLERGARPFVADSPGFGSGRSVARRIGMAAVLRELGVPLKELRAPVRVRLPFGWAIGISRDALEADAVLDLPKFKAHGQMRLSLAVKNLFGCVPGTRKAVAHTLHGDLRGPHGPRFESLITEIAQALPPTGALVDGVTAMHVMGPTGGRPFPLGCIAAAPQPWALDTALYTLLGLAPEQVPLWREAQRRDLPGSRLQDLAFPLERPEAFDAAGFELPARLIPMNFHPVRLCISAVKRAWARLG